ncbi:MAG TPA: TIGR03936 family radical SAM-associated protein [Bacillota bacterium]|nr:TIGR03936 family radical SAM-associated protein [Bacillota bacterium]
MLPKVIRIRFAKRGRLKFISHLDLCRTLQSAMIRAGLPLWYTEGFNPHPRIAVALPLPVGCESECELLDVRVTELPNLELTVKKLNEATVPELEILEAYEPVTKFSDIGFAQYEITLELPFSEDLAELFSGPVIVAKHTKRGDVDTDIFPMVKSISFAPKGSGTFCRALLFASPESYLNPEYIVRAIEKQRGLDQYAFEYSVCRTGILDKLGKNFR